MTGAQGKAKLKRKTSFRQDSDDLHLRTNYNKSIKDPHTPLDIDLETEMEFKEFKPRFKSAKTRFKLSAGLNF